MKAFFYILSIILILAGAYFSYDNKNKLVDQEAQTADTAKRKVSVQGVISKQEAIRDDLNAQIEKAKNSIAETESSIESANSKQKRHNNTITNLESELREIESELAKFEELQMRLEEALRGQNINSVEEIPTKIEELRVESQEKQEDLKNLELINDKLNQKVATESTEKGSVDNRLSDIKKRINNNDMVATVTSVNPEWGFVIINAGSDNSNIESNTELVVKRSGKYLGKLKAAAVSPNQTICDIDGKGVGLVMRPGDSVILKEAVVK